MLDRAELPVDTVALARFPIGKPLVRLLAEGAAGGRIVETEAYVIGDLARGPGRLSVALAVDRRLDGIDLCQAGPLWLGSAGQAPDEIGESTRIGITRAADSLLRFYVRGNRFVSGSSALNR